jgi:hypothetical protein
MTAPIVVIELALMTMYQNRKVNLLIITLSITLGLLFFTLIRRQTGISDKQFLSSMIPTMQPRSTCANKLLSTTPKSHDCVATSYQASNHRSIR